jgi:hypothetical protein
MGAMSGGLSIIGGLVGAMGAMQQAEAEAKAHEYNAAVAERNRGTIHEQTYAAVDDALRARSREIDNIRGKFAANGMTYTGSALDVMSDTIREEALGIQRTQYRGRLAEIEQIDTKNLELMGADAARKAGTISAVSSILNGFAGAVSAAS